MEAGDWLVHLWCYFSARLAIVLPWLVLLSPPDQFQTWLTSITGHSSRLWFSCSLMAILLVVLLTCSCLHLCSPSEVEQVRTLDPINALCRCRWSANQFIFRTDVSSPVLPSTNRTYSRYSQSFLGSSSFALRPRRATRGLFQRIPAFRCRQCISQELKLFRLVEPNWL